MANSHTINETIKLANNGKQTAWSALFIHLQPMIQKICRTMLKGKSTDEIEDAILIVMAKAFQNLEKYDNSTYCLTTWVGKIAENVCKDILRQKMKTVLSIDELISNENAVTFAEHITDGSANGEQVLIQKEYTAAANKKISTLKGNYKAAVEMRLEGKSYNEIVSELGVPLATVKNLLNRATKKLQ